ncbi:hypothetical protein FRB99_003092 [Tulasnella sp. 403]|nr:hypothetical protein FRB99_003092 [Tulasnella sp. 403]
MLPFTTTTTFTTLLFVSFLFPSSVFTFSFNISSRVVQCANLSLSWDGGEAPWNILLIPVGELANPPETRTIVDANVTQGNTYSFQLKFPAGSSFLAMMSDATGVGTGGTSQLITVLDGDTNCLPTSATHPLFYFYLDPPTGNPSQCGTWGISWDPIAQSPVRITALLPGGQSFPLPVPVSGTSFNWQVNMRQGTQFLLTAGDSRGFGTGGSTNIFTVQGGGSGCINNLTPSSTAGPAAGGIYATGSGAGSVTGAAGDGPHPTSGTTAGGTKNVGAIVGGTLGGIAGFGALLLLLVFFHRHRVSKQQGDAHHKPEVDLMDDCEGHGTIGNHAGEAEGHGPLSEPGSSSPADNANNRPSLSNTTNISDMPIYTRFRSAPSIPPLDFGSETGNDADVLGVESIFTGSDFRHGVAAGGRPHTPTTDTSLRTPGTSGQRANKSGVSRLRPVNIIQHDDAGGLSVPAGVAEEPPSYEDVHGSSSDRF